MRIGVIGAGSWGTTLAAVAARNGQAVTLWGRNAEVVEAIEHTHRNPLYLGDLDLPAELHATTERAAVAGTEALLLVVPAQALRAVCADFAPHIGPTTPVAMPQAMASTFLTAPPTSAPITSSVR